MANGATRAVMSENILNKGSESALKSVLVDLNTQAARVEENKSSLKKGKKK